MFRCYFCHTEVADVTTAVEANWIPSFYDDDREICEPVCPSCTSMLLDVGEDGELEIAAHAGFADEAESAERGQAWLQAGALWQMAADKCQHAARRLYYEQQAARCRRIGHNGSHAET